MKLYRLEYEAKLEGLELTDSILVPGPDKAKAQACFLELVERSGGLITSHKNSRLLLPLQGALRANIKVTSCKELK